MKAYKGLNTPRGLTVFRPNGTPLPTRLDLQNHSPTGFSCGFGGSGPAQLALALLADVFDDDIALEHYQDFKWSIIAKLPRDKPWSLTVEQIREAVSHDPLVAVASYFDYAAQHRKVGALSNDEYVTITVTVQAIRDARAALALAEGEQPTP